MYVSFQAKLEKKKEVFMIVILANIFPKGIG